MGVAKRRYVPAAAMQRTRVQTPVHRFCQTAPKTSCGARSLPRDGSGAMRRTRLALAFGRMDRGSRNISDLRSPGRTDSLAPGARRRGETRKGAAHRESGYARRARARGDFSASDQFGRTVGLLTKGGTSRRRRVIRKGSPAMARLPCHLTGHISTPSKLIRVHAVPGPPTTSRKFDLRVTLTSP